MADPNSPAATAEIERSFDLVQRYDVFGLDVRLYERRLSMPGRP